jgi:WD40 repeat protein
MTTTIQSFDVNPFDGRVAVTYFNGGIKIFQDSHSEKNDSISQIMSGRISLAWTDKDMLVIVSSDGHSMIYEQNSLRKLQIKRISKNEFFHVKRIRNKPSCFAIINDTHIVMMNGTEWVSTTQYSSSSEYPIACDVHPSGTVIAISCARSREIRLIAIAHDTSHVHSLLAADPGPILRTIKMADETATPVACCWSRYGEIFAYSSNRSGGVFLWNAASKHTHEVAIQGVVRSITLVGNLFAVLTSNGAIVYVDSDSGSIIHEEEASGCVKSCTSIGVNKQVITAPDGTHVLVLRDIPN